MIMTLITFLILSLATWRISSLFVNEMGPADILESMRHKIGVRYDERSVRYGGNMIAETFLCVWCLSMWVGVALMGLYLLNESASVVVAGPFAFSAVAVVVEKSVNG